jgi:hypothetical protein
MSATIIIDRLHFVTSAKKSRHRMDIDDPADQAVNSVRKRQRGSPGQVLEAKPLSSIRHGPVIGSPELP